MHELASSQPFFLQRITTSIPGMLPKAYRWVGEGKIHEGMARLYERIEGSVEGDAGREGRM